MAKGNWKRMEVSPKKTVKKRSSVELESDEKEEQVAEIDPEEKHRRKMAKNKRRKERKKLGLAPPKVSQGSNKKKDDQQENEVKPSTKSQSPKAKPSKKQKVAPEDLNERQLALPFVFKKYPMTPTATKELAKLGFIAKQHKCIDKFNKFISEHGSKKELGIALNAFRKIIASIGWKPTEYTITAVINSCVRCGEQTWAQSIFDYYKDKISFNEVVYTVMFKGLAESHLDEAVAMLAEMKEKDIHPNLRTFNTLLRGCVRNGNIAIADQIFKIMAEQDIAPDISSYEYYIKSACIAQEMGNAWEVFNKMQEQDLDSPVVFTEMAMGCALLGDTENAQKLLHSAFATTGKQEVKKMSDRSNHARESLELWTQLRDGELKSDLQRLRLYLKNLRESEQEAPMHAMEASPRVIFFPREDEGRLSLPEIFDNKKPVRLEIASGTGDWVVQKAIDNPDFNWVALELRKDRVFQIWTKMVLQGVDNLLILGGSAEDILQNSIKGKAFEHVYVNYPEPPVWEGSRRHLLSQGCLNQVDTFKMNSS
eukprot:TRINITY_DN273_c0_g1_i2.p1 TRINITY_DN273_c0_g1~~TRINITY_DN273_c0_g1_i2.p1  ORF type:complete len:589 (-),score=161.84 TRINITY_DN273_c0_g1_i2:293-1906(-)